MTTLKPRAARVVIYQGDDLERIAELRRAADLAERDVAIAKAKSEGATARLGDDDEDVAAATVRAEEKKAEHDAFVDEAADRAVVIHLQHIERKRFRKLMADHPPKRDNDEDENFGVHVETFADEFLPPSVERIDPEPDGGRERFLDSLSEGDFSRLFVTAYYLNRAPGSDPLDGRFSSAPRSSGETSR